MESNRPSLDPGSTGYLQIRGEGGITAAQMRALLQAFDDGYTSIASVEVELAARVGYARRLSRWSRRYGPPDFFLPWLSQPAAIGGAFNLLGSVPAAPLVISRVVLESPGFWEFVGTLNPLEVIRQYLNDRHERKKDNEYRSSAERERLALDNAMQSLEILDRYLAIEREYGDDSSDVAASVRQNVAAAIRPGLERLGEIDDLGLIGGGSATTGIERPVDRPSN
ncbi:hypothetical protein LRS13_12625 [Svornostia abyssi]|uniref:Uncharacterized protein n=1 Tax=Svornostia abyssi TaxID=2898438 RepID=A0ABY5PA45_9ACTN|nr:hypothetical protein LRS13_12625 [Parviterribacteraceae bacterium J379]